MSLLSLLLEACADELERLDWRVALLLKESVPSASVELLPEYESELDLSSSGTTAERQARVIAQTIAQQGYRPVDFATTLAPLLGTVTVIERTAAQAADMGDVREIFRFFIFRDPLLPGTYYVTSAQELVDTIKPSHTAGHVIESVNALYEDPFSLYDRDIMGA